MSLRTTFSGPAAVQRGQMDRSRRPPRVGQREPTPQINLMDEKILSKVLKAHFNNKYVSDITIVAADGREIHCHYAILSMFSEPLYKMFKTEMLEGTTRRVTVQEVDPDALETMLKFMYTGECCICDESLIPLMAAADRFDVQCLYQMCKNYRSSHLEINPRNCFALLERAFEYKVDDIISKAAECIMYYVVPSDESWKHMSFGALEAVVKKAETAHQKSHINMIIGISRWAEVKRAERWEPGISLLQKCEFNTLSLQEMATACTLDIVQESQELKDLIFQAMRIKGKRSWPSENGDMQERPLLFS